MPIYEYQCTSCQHELEKLQKISDPPLTQCPDCYEEALRKKVSAAGFRLKGGGWYETDFKSDRRKNIAGEAGGDTSKTTSEKSDKAKKADKKPAQSASGSD